MEKPSSAASAGRSFLNRLKHPSQFSKFQLGIFVIAFGAIGYLIFSSFAASPLVATLQAEQMTLPAGASTITDSSASGGKAVKFTADGTATGSVSFASAATSLTVMAKGDQCQGSPVMSVKLDSTTLLPNTSVSATSWTTYSVTPASSFASGTHALSIIFTNSGSKTHGNSKNNCARNLYVDVTNFFGPAPVASPPTVALSASPTSVAAGQASTLTWASTNATSCTASGAWSGSEPTSGSVSTGALNQTSTYSLTCTGSGGNTTGSATVTVNSPTPTVSISASPISITSGQSSTLTWTSTNAASCTASGAWSGSEPSSGSKSVSPTSTSTYSLTCTGSGGSATASATVSINTGSGTYLFDDEFNGTSLDTTKWNVKTGNAPFGDPAIASNVFVDGNGRLHVRTARNSSGGYTGGFLATFNYGSGWPPRGSKHLCRFHSILKCEP